MLRIHRAALSVLITLALPGCQSRPPSALAQSSPDCTLVDKGFGPNGTVPVKVETVVTGLSVPWGIAFLPDGDWLITERPGRIRLVQKGQLLAEPVAKVPIAEGQEGGLLGVAVHPGFTDNRLFYVYATVDNQGQRENRVLRYKLSEDHRAAVLDKVLFSGIKGAQYHDGGRLRFGPDGMLYIGTGDAHAPESAASLESSSGKLLRLSPDGAIPPDNPFSGSPVFLRGIRNTQGFDWLDPKTLAVTDHGPSGDTGRTGHDEVTVARAGDNLGWPKIYGCEADEQKATPSLTWTEAVPPGGAAIYTGAAIPEWKGSLLIGTLRAKHLHRVVFDPSNPRRVSRHEVYFQGEPPAGFGRLRDVVMGPDGALYVTTSNCDGRGECPADKDRVLRITR